MLAFGFSLIGAASPSWGDESSHSRIRSHDTADSTPKKFVIGTTAFAIPAAYVYRKAERKGVKTTALTLLAILPDIDHSSRANVKEFECKGHCNRIEFTIRTRGKSEAGEAAHRTVEQFVREFSKYHKDAKATGKELFGFRITEYAQGHEQLLVKYQGETPTAFIRCQAAGTRVSPGCTGFFDYSEDLVVSFRYGRTHLPLATEIQNRLASKVASWEASARN